MKATKKNMNCNFILLTEDNNISTSLLTDSKEKQIVLMVGPASPRRTQLGKQYLKQYDTLALNPQQPGALTSATRPSTSTPEPPLDKSKSKDIRFDKSLWTKTTEDLSALSSLTSLYNRKHPSMNDYA